MGDENAGRSAGTTFPLVNGAAHSEALDTMVMGVRMLYTRYVEEPHFHTSGSPGSTATRKATQTWRYSGTPRL